MFAGRWEAMIRVPAGGAAVSATNGLGGPSTVTVPSADYYFTAVGALSSIITVFQAQLNASRPNGWTVSLSTGANGTGKVTINCSSTPWSITWTSTVLRDLLGFNANIAGVSTAQTGAGQARGLWFPDCPLKVDGHPSMAPKVSDLITTEGPTGFVSGAVSNFKYRHRGLVYSHVPEVRYRSLIAAVANGAWEQFLDDTQWGQGPSWFDVSSKVQIYWNQSGTERPLGSDFASDTGVVGWNFPAESVEAQPAIAGHTSYWQIAIPELVSSGT